MKVKVTITYPSGLSYNYKWEPVDMHCPNCGKRAVWHEAGPVDYFLGEPHVCMACEHEWTIQGPHAPGGPGETAQVVAQIRAALR